MRTSHTHTHVCTRTQTHMHARTHNKSEISNLQKYSTTIAAVFLSLGLMECCRCLMSRSFIKGRAMAEVAQC